MERNKSTWTIPEVAEILGIARNTAYELAARDELPVRTIRLGRRVLVSKKELEAFLGGDPVDSPSR